MSNEFKRGSIVNNLLKLAPLIVLFISVLNEIDLNYIKFLHLIFHLF